MSDQVKRCLTIYDILFVLFRRSGERICSKLREDVFVKQIRISGCLKVLFLVHCKNKCTYGRVVVVLSFTIETVIPYRTICMS